MCTGASGHRSASMMDAYDLEIAVVESAANLIGGPFYGNK